MSLFSKILDKLGRHNQEEPIIIGTSEVASPDPLSTVPTPASKAASHEKSLPVAKPTGAAPLSIEENNRDQSTMDKK